MVSNAKIACVAHWRERGCPNTSIRAAKAWALENARAYRMQVERDAEARIESSVYRSPNVHRARHR